VRGYTLDTGALVALERRSQRATAILRVAREDGATVTVPANVVAEWWRKATRMRETILAAVVVEPMDENLAKQVGEAMAAVPKATLVDANVVVSAALRGDIVLTSDVQDVTRLSDRFPAVRVLRV
jgi:predicted nucleic acid-binding protein